MHCCPFDYVPFTIVNRMQKEFTGNLNVSSSCACSIHNKLEPITLELKKTSSSLYVINVFDVENNK